jgi:hypothetical protein
MITYKEFRPTGFDPKGLGLSDQQDWLVVPCARNRDSSCLEESNFATALKMLDGEGEDVEVHRFGHWANGWFEIIIVRPDTPAAKEAEDIEASFENYSILDENDFSEREYNAASQVWEHMRLSDRIELAHKYRFHVMACRRDSLPSDESGELVSYLAE